MSAPRLIEKRLLWATVASTLMFILYLRWQYIVTGVNWDVRTNWIYFHSFIIYIAITATMYSVVSLINVLVTAVRKRGVHDDVVGFFGGIVFTSGMGRFASTIFHLTLDGKLVEEVNGEYIQVDIPGLGVAAVLAIVGLILIVKG